MKYQIYDKIFEINDNILSINGTTIELPTNALLGLQLFLNSNNETISKDTLIKTIWGEIIVSDDSIFKVIQSIRKLFKNLNINETVLVNVYGKGYKITPQIITLKNETLKKKTKTTISEDSIKIKKPKRLFYIPLILIVFISIIFLLTQLNIFDSNKAKITPEIYSSYKKKIKEYPVLVLKQLNTNYKISNLNKRDQAKLYTLKGLALYSQGKYQLSMEKLKQSLALDEGNANLAIADAYHQIAVINYYKAKANLIMKNLTPAMDYYKELNDLKELYESQRLLSDYYVLINKHEQALKTIEKLITTSGKSQHKFAQLRAYVAKYLLYDKLNDSKNKIITINKIFNLAADSGNAFYISFAYGEMSINDLQLGHFIKAMQKVTKTIPYALSLKNTNKFQQIFSYLYNILGELGHNKLAVKYLTKAIAIQNHFNSEGHINKAELNLARINIKLKKYNQADILLSNLLTYNNLSPAQMDNVKAWKAINRFYLKDSISAYSLAKEVFNNQKSSNKAKFIAAIALALSADDLEREQEAQLIIKQLAELVNTDWLIEYKLYLESSLIFYQNVNPEKYSYFNQLNKNFEIKLQHIKNQTKPNAQNLKKLDVYISHLLEN